MISDSAVNFLLSIRGTPECYHTNSVNVTVSSGNNLAIDVPHLMIFEIDSVGVRYYKGATLLGQIGH